MPEVTPRAFLLRLCYGKSIAWGTSVKLPHQIKLLRLREPVESILLAVLTGCKSHLVLPVPELLHHSVIAEYLCRSFGQ